MTSSVWCPVQQPPVLSPYCDLSDDAQVVLRAIQADYERKKEILINRALHQGHVNYYSSIYRNSFHADIPPQASDVQVRHDNLLADPVLPTMTMSTSPSLFSHCSTQLPIHGDNIHVEALLGNSTPDAIVITQVLEQGNTIIPDDGTCISNESTNFSIPTPIEDLSPCLSKEGNDLMVGMDMSDVAGYALGSVGEAILPLIADLSSSPDLSSLLPAEDTSLSLLDGGTLVTDSENKLANLKMVCDKLDENESETAVNICPPHLPASSLLGSPAKQAELGDPTMPLKAAVKRKIQLPWSEHCSGDTFIPVPKSTIDETDQRALVTSAHISYPTPAKQVKVTDQSSQEDLDLDIIENLLGDDAVNTAKSSRKFKAPFKPERNMDSSKKKTVQQQSLVCDKRETSGFEDRELLREFNIHNVCHLSEEKRERISGEVLQSQEVLLTLTYSDNSTQLTSQYKRKATIEETKKLQGLAIGYQSIRFLEDPLADLKSVQAKPLHCLYIPLTDKDQSTSKWAKQFIQRLMTSSVRKISFLAKDFIGNLLDTFRYDTTQVTSSWIVLDPKIAAWLLDPDHPVNVFQELLADKQQTAETQSSCVKQLVTDFRLLASTMLQLFYKLKARELWSLFLNVETRLIPLLAVMERGQLKVDVAKFVEASDILQSKLSKLEKKAHILAGHSFSIKSHPQLRQVLFEELCLDKKVKDKRKISMTSVNHVKSTSEVVLTQLCDTHPLPAVVLEYRQLQKLKSTYVDGLMHCIESGHMRTHWDQTAAATGRLTSCQPNLQSVPKQPLLISDYKTSYIAGRDSEQESCQIFARDPFISEENTSFLAADFQQIELRLLAHLADDPKLISVFQNPGAKDIFMELTAQWLGKPLSDITHTEREQTKRVVYSVMYGAGKDKLADYLKIEISHAKAIMTSFLEKFPAINSFTKTSTQFCQNHGYMCTIFKRRRLIPNINSKSPVVRAQAERQAVNFAVQGSAADICKAAMLQVEAALVHRPHVKPRLLLQIHDELLYEVPDENLEEFKCLVKDVMESVDTLCGDLVKLRVPLSVSLSVGKYWGHLREVSS